MLVVKFANLNSQLETYFGPGSEATHGSRGPEQISGGTYRANRSEDQFITAAKNVGYPEIPNLQVGDLRVLFPSFGLFWVN